MICEKCNFEHCKQTDPFYIKWYCPACNYTFIPSENHKLLMKLKENLRLKLDKSAEFLTVEIYYNNQYITGDSIYLEGIV